MEVHKTEAHAKSPDLCSHTFLNAQVQKILTEKLSPFRQFSFGFKIPGFPKSMKKDD